MLIALIGSRYAGKDTIAQHLVTQHAFKEVRITTSRSDGIDMNQSTSDKLRFTDHDGFLDYSTKHWSHDFVTTDLQSKIEIEKFLKRPFFVLVNVEAPTRSNINQESMRTPLKSIIPFATYTILNNSSLNDLLTSIDRTHLQKLRKGLRPDWDQYFMTLANLASLRSNCMKRRVGAVLITKRDKRVLSTGYNGTPRGMTNCNEGGCARFSKCGTDLNECLCLHAEENALLEAGRDRMGAGEGSTLYCNTCPCLRCSVKIVQCGVREVVYSFSYSMDIGTAAVFAEAGVQLRQISLP
ncbi:uncharacterized protein MELLADRAFT_54347 [Melampsora larici-populina 98AG31]|uniref:Deoxycytidylate deaminase n=1 Tax=Melampsora larici-populina (strain 98AG31 / pathotype 3-4-7) TaxID=747676 RepID=F4SDL1_MELLP|nr:uncharacterized protein MELLADRAFT_54347 [Melampsora larici-populina 98AG31]EGF97265.1 hypothetical protein MELLADRAFT_54347 [Melampsora larici-populina 98AG31]